MGAPLANEYWMLRTKHGRDRLFSDPKTLLKAATDYFKWREENPLYETDYRGKDATLVLIPKMRAFTISGLCVYLGINTDYFNQFKRSIEGRDDEISKDFSRVITLIYDIIYDQKFTGAAAGFLNPNIIARDLGLTDKAELRTINSTADEYIDYTELSDDALKEITDAAENKRLKS